MRQRAALLRTFLAGRDVLLLDEPFGALDALTREAMREWLLGVWEADRKTILLVTHDVAEAVFLSDRVYVMSGRPGRIARRSSTSRCRGPRALELTATPRVRRARASGCSRRCARRRGRRWGRREHGGIAAGARARRAARAAAARGARGAGAAARPAAAAASALLLLGAVAALRRACRVSARRSFPSPVEVGARARARPQRAAVGRGDDARGDPARATRLAIVVGVALAVAVSSSRLVERAVYPWLVVSQMVPIPALAPVVVLWTGFDIRPKLIVIALVTLLPDRRQHDRRPARDRPRARRPAAHARRRPRAGLPDRAAARRRCRTLFSGLRVARGVRGDRRRVRRVGGARLGRPRLPDPQLRQPDRDGGRVRGRRRARGDRRRAVRARSGLRRAGRAAVVADGEDAAA